MLGWMVFVYPKSNEDAKLASWEVGVSGLRWLDDLVTKGKAVKLNGNGYPTRYDARAADVLPLLDEVTGRIDFTHKLFKPKFELERIAACPPDQMLTIDAWDQS